MASTSDAVAVAGSNGRMGRRPRQRDGASSGPYGAPVLRGSEAFGPHESLAIGPFLAPRPTGDGTGEARPDIPATAPECARPEPTSGTRTSATGTIPRPRPRGRGRTSRLPYPST